MKMEGPYDGISIQSDFYIWDQRYEKIGFLKTKSGWQPQKFSKTSFDNED